MKIKAEGISKETSDLRAKLLSNAKQSQLARKQHSPTPKPDVPRFSLPEVLRCDPAAAGRGEQGVPKGGELSLSPPAQPPAHKPGMASATRSRLGVLGRRGL